MNSLYYRIEDWSREENYVSKLINQHCSNLNSSIESEAKQCFFSSSGEHIILFSSSTEGRTNLEIIIASKLDDPGYSRAVGLSIPTSSPDDILQLKRVVGEVVFLDGLMQGVTSLELERDSLKKHEFDDEGPLPSF